MCPHARRREGKNVTSCSWRSCHVGTYATDCATLLCCFTIAISTSASSHDRQHCCICYNGQPNEGIQAIQHDTAESGQRRVFANTKPPDSKAGLPWMRLRSTSRSSTAPSARVLSMLCLAHSYTSHNPGLQNSSSRAWQGSAHLRRRECSSSGRSHGTPEAEGGHQPPPPVLQTNDSKIRQTQSSLQVDGSVKQGAARRSQRAQDDLLPAFDYTAMRAMPYTTFGQRRGTTRICRELDDISLHVRRSHSAVGTSLSPRRGRAACSWQLKSALFKPAEAGFAGMYSPACCHSAPRQ